MKKKKLRKCLIILVIIAVFIAGIFIGKVLNKSNKNTNENSQTTQIVETQVETKTIENTLTSSGEISASSTEKISLNTSKYFKTMCVESGDIVKKGANILQYTNGTDLTAEYDCMISDYSVPETSSKCTSSNYIEVQNIQTMTMTLNVSESDINKIEKNQEVTITLSAIENKNYTGTIKSVSSVGTYQSSGTTFSAIVEFENDGNVKPGMSASCSIVVEKAENCIAVPINAVQTNNDQKYVVVVLDDGSTKNVNIETGISNDSYVQVTSGLNGGEKIQMVQIVTNNKETNNNEKGMPGDGQRPEMGDMEKNGGQMPDMKKNSQ